MTDAPNGSHKMEIRIWAESPLIGDTPLGVEYSYGVKIIKVARGEHASDNQSIALREADYITYTGTVDACLKLQKKAKPENELVQVRIGANSPLVGKTKEEAEKRLNVKIVDISRGIKKEAVTGALLAEGTYITCVGTSAACLRAHNECIRRTRCTCGANLTPMTDGEIYYQSCGMRCALSIINTNVRYPFLGWNSQKFLLSLILDTEKVEKELLKG